MKDLPLMPFVFVENSLTGIKQVPNFGLNKLQLFMLFVMFFKINYNKNLIPENWQNEPAFPLVFFDPDTNRQYIYGGITVEDIELLLNILCVENIDNEKNYLDDIINNYSYKQSNKKNIIL
jgi:hypothetical protein